VGPRNGRKGVKIPAKIEIKKPAGIPNQIVTGKLNSGVISLFKKIADERKNQRRTKSPVVSSRNSSLQTTSVTVTSPPQSRTQTKTIRRRPQRKSHLNHGEFPGMHSEITQKISAKNKTPALVVETKHPTDFVQSFLENYQLL